MQPRIHRRAKALGLGVVGVHVVLAVHVVACELEQPADGVAKDRAAAVADVQRPCRVDARELDLQALASPYRRRAVAGSLGAHRPDQPLQPLGREPEVHIPADRLHGRGALRYRDGLGEPGSDRRRRLLEHLRELEPSRACIVAAVRALGATQLQVGQLSIDPEGADG